VIVELSLPGGRHVAEGHLRNTAAVLAQRRDIAATSTRVLASLQSSDRRVIRRYATVPYVALEVGPAALAALDASSSDVSRVFEDELVRPVLAESVPLIQGDQAWAAGYDGTGTTVAILDTGVDSTHPFLANKVVDESCFSSTIAGRTLSTCPDGSDQQIGPGSATPCVLDVCIHGTHVAGIAAGNGATASVPFSGVAKGAQIMAVEVFTDVIDPATCGGTAPCAGAFSSDIIAGLEQVYARAAALNVVSVNMSLGGSLFNAPCDGQPYKPAIDNLRSINVATVVAAGNDGSSTSLSSPGCISSVVSVGSVDKSNQVSSFSDVAPFLSLFAPGTAINSSVPGGTYRVLSGTSMATPHVTGTWAILRQAVPAAGVGLILDALQRTGLPITDTRIPSGGATVPRVKIFDALQMLRPASNPVPTLTSVSPARLRAGPLAPLTLTFTGQNFNASSVAYWNGVAKPTTVVSTTQIQAQIPVTDLAALGSFPVWVTTPAPGGGTSESRTVTLDPPPTLAVSATRIAPSTKVTMTLADGFGGSGDWLALASTSAPTTSYVTFTYVGAGVTTRTWTVTMPATPGSYEFRLFPNNGYTLAAKSPVVTVDAAVNPAPAITTLSPASAYAGGAAFTLTVNGTGFVSSSVVRWNGSNRPTTFVSGTQLQASIAAADIATAGADSVTVLSPAPGGGASAGVTFTASAPPALAVSATTVAPGGSITATLTGGAGGSTDWLALASTSSPDTSYIRYVFVGGGVTTRTWTVDMPTTPGSYEFRYFLNGGYTRAATSPTVAVGSGGGGGSTTPVITSLSPSSAIAGSAPFTLTVNGNNFVASSVVRWNGSSRPTTFVSATQLTASIASADVATTGSASITVFTTDPGGTSAPATFTIGASSPTQLSVSASSVSAGSPITVTLTNGPGTWGDWISFALTSAANSSYTTYTFVGTGITTRTWTVTAPFTAGTYEFRFFPANGYTRTATSPPVTVTVDSNPSPTITSLSPAQVAAGTGAFTLTVNGSGFVSSSVVKWNGAARPTTLANGALTASITAADITSPGTAQITVSSPSPGGGTSGALTFTIVKPPTLTVSASTVAPGSSVTVTLTDGLGGTWDWLALASSTAPEASYIASTFVGAGVTSRTWTVTMPSTPGTYEFRLFPNNGYTRIATSPPVTVVVH